MDGHSVNRFVVRVAVIAILGLIFSLTLASTDDTTTQAWLPVWATQNL